MYNEFKIIFLDIYVFWLLIIWLMFLYIVFNKKTVKCLINFVYQVFDESPHWNLRWKHVVFLFSFLYDEIAQKSISLTMLCVNRVYLPLSFIFGKTFHNYISFQKKLKYHIQTITLKGDVDVFQVG